MKEKNTNDGVTSGTPMSLDESRALVLDLRTHQIELEMQNEALRNTQLELTSARNEFSNLFELSPVSYLKLDLKGFILNVNQTFLELVELEVFPIVKQLFSAFVHPDSSDAYYLFLSAVVKTRAPSSCDLRLKHRKNEHGERDVPLWVRADAKVVAAATGNNLEIYLSLVDITASREMHSELARYAAATLDSQNRLYTIIKTAADGIITIDGRGIVDSFNLSAETSFGYTAFEVIGRNVKMLMPEIYASRHDAYLAQYAVSGEKNIIGIERELKGLRKDGSTFPLILSVSEATWKGEKIFTGSIRDLTERYDLQKQLQQSQKMEALGTLAGGIAHDFNNILANILGNTELARNALPAASIIRKNLDSVYASGQRAKKLIRQIMTFSRMEVTSQRLVNLAATVHDALEMVRSLTPANIEIREYLQTDAIVLADDNQIYQIVQNLCSNAQQAIGVEGGTIDVAIREESTWLGSGKGDKVRCIALSVKDSGCGIKQEDLTRVFDPFFSTKEVGMGTGLGLAVVDGIVKQHGGRITVDSIKDEGSTFTVFFPGTTATEKLAQKTQTRRDPSPLNRKKAGHILIVDDEESLVSLYNEYLSEEGYVVTATADPVKALSIFKENPNQFDVVVTDNNMPHMTGQQLAKALLAIRPELPILLSSGFVDTSMEANIQSLGIRQCLLKPLRLKELQEAIDACLDPQT